MALRGPSRRQVIFYLEHHGSVYPASEKVPIVLGKAKVIMNLNTQKRNATNTAMKLIKTEITCKKTPQQTKNSVYTLKFKLASWFALLTWPLPGFVCLGVCAMSTWLAGRVAAATGAVEEMEKGSIGLFSYLYIMSYSIQDSITQTILDALALTIGTIRP